MTLRQKISWQIGGMMLALLFVSAAAFWGIDSLRQDYSVALDGYQRLRQVYVAGTHLSTAQKLLQWQHPLAVSSAVAEVRSAVTDLEAQPALSNTAGSADSVSARQIRSALQSIAARLDATIEGPAAVSVEAERDAIVGQLGKIAELSSGIRRGIEDAQQAADSKRQATLVVLIGVCAAVVLAGVVLGVVHYRGVMLPILRLSEGVHRLTAGQFKGRVEVRGQDELASLARDFNRMAEQLDGFYYELEQKVAEKSRELVRSERLASVGYLAAGVAHEINNPLGIMLNYAEFALLELRKSQPIAGDGDSDAVKSLRIICDEAFRCKAITQRLLSLARGGDEARRPISLLAVANEVAAIVGGLKEHREKRLVVSATFAKPGSTLGNDKEPCVLAVEPEMKQVLLNLAVNALEAVSPSVGEVRLELKPDGDEAVELTVVDNGRGMTPDVLDRVFEPFFTEHRGHHEGGRVGTGLGLSITHAIIRDHGGTIVASSEGPGKGSRFIVRMPVAKEISE